MQRFSPAQYLMIDIANNFGKNDAGKVLDKALWEERLEWFEQNEHQLESLLPKAAEPALYFAAVQAYRDMEAGKPIGYPISLDATSSGLQILAAITGDRKAAELCNVVNTGNREDAYSIVFEVMVSYLLARLGEHAGTISRDDCKTAIMTALYGSKAEPKRVFGEGAQLRIFYEVMAELAPAAWELNEFFIDIWNPEALSNDWILPDNFHVHVKVMSQVAEQVHFLNTPYETFRKVNAPVEEGRSLGANTIHSLDGMIVREMTRRCMYDESRVHSVKAILGGWFMVLENQEEHIDMVGTLWGHYLRSGYLSARILDHIDSTTLLMVDATVIQELVDSLPKKPFKIITVHDCFRVHPNYGDDLREQYNRQLMLLAKSNMLQFLLSQIMGKEITINKLDPDLWKDIMDAEYSLS